MTQSNADEPAVLLDSEGNRVELLGEMDVGRSPTCAITIDDAKVSRKHATIYVNDTEVKIEDHGSSNGTWINEFRIAKPTVLMHGDKICFEKHCFVFQLPNVEGELDATVVDAMPEEDATVVSTMPEAEAEAETEEPPATGGDFDLPGSWVDSGTGEETRFLSMEEMAEKDALESAERVSDLAHLMVVSGPVYASTFELALGNTSEPDVWEIGRDDGVEIALDDASVSSRHAQLIHQGGRWRLVNLVSTNGIYVNDEKRLTAYLSDGDIIRLGSVNLIFYAALGVEEGIAIESEEGASPAVNSTVWITAAVVAAAVLGLSWWLL